MATNEKRISYARTHVKLLPNGRRRHALEQALDAIEAGEAFKAGGLLQLSETLPEYGMTSEQREADYIVGATIAELGKALDRRG